MTRPHITSRRITMTLRFPLTLLLSVLALTACDHGHNGDQNHDHSHDGAGTDGETRAYYGDEEPVDIESLPDDHHHDHDHDHDHGHDDGHDHDHSDGHDHDHEDEHDHDHGTHSHDH